LFRYNGITNHIKLTPIRHSCSPHAVFPVTTNIFVSSISPLLAHHPYDWAVNCSATSPDSRLRVVVGDIKNVLIVDAERGKTEFALNSHQGFGFTTAWSDDNFTIATGNQDQTVRMYDARHLAYPLKVFSMQMAGCRTLRFSPIGNGGKCVLVMADLIYIVDAVGFEEAQTLTFWGEAGESSSRSMAASWWLPNAIGS
jgi:WD40 repeat protein